MPDGRALKTLEVGLAAPSATGRIWWGNGYCCCKRKLPAASTAGGDGNRGICLQEVRSQWFAITLPQQQPVPVCFALIKEKDFKSGTQGNCPRCLCLRACYRSQREGVFSQQTVRLVSKPICISSLILTRFLPWLQGSNVNRI